MYLSKRYVLRKCYTQLFLEICYTVLGPGLAKLQHVGGGHSTDHESFSMQIQQMLTAKHIYCPECSPLSYH